MQQKVRRSANRSGTQPKRIGAALLLAASTATGVTGCASGDEMMTTMGVPAATTGTPPSNARPEPNTLNVTGNQRAYLDALKDAGVKPSSDLLALTVGSYVCQARAAKRTDQQVWDFVLPMVRGDIHDEVHGKQPAVLDVNTATADYIRIATERLC